MLPKLASPARHKLLVCGRRWRKSTLALIAAIHGHGPRFCMRGAKAGANVWWITPSFNQAQSAWLALRGTLSPVAKHVSEANRRILLPGDGAVTIKSAVNIASLVGDMRGLDGVILDEAAKYSPEVWQKAISPAIADRKGWTIWPSTPEGYNYYKQLFDDAPNTPGWERWQEPSSANPFFDPAEIEARRKEGVPESIIRQEFYAEFVLMGPGRTYSEFKRDDHIMPCEYSPAEMLDLCVNFKVAPSAWIVTQGDPKSGADRVLDEITVDLDTSVRAYLDEFRRRYPDHAQGRNVRVFGDASATINGRSTGMSDYELVRAGLPQAKVYPNTAAMADKDRVNAVNNVLRDQNGDVRAQIDPSCIRLIRDMEYTRNAEASFAVNRNDQPGLGQYAHAWSCKLLYLAPVLKHRLVQKEERQRSWPQSTPEARRAQGKAYRAKVKGQLVQPKACEDCNTATPNLEMAHVDYDRPLDVRWLCKRCHTIFDLTNPKGGTVGSQH